MAVRLPLLVDTPTPALAASAAGLAIEQLRFDWLVVPFRQTNIEPLQCEMPPLEPEQGWLRASAWGMNNIRAITKMTIGIYGSFENNGLGVSAT